MLERRGTAEVVAVFVDVYGQGEVSEYMAIAPGRAVHGVISV
jgi:hypothetical protein